MRAGADPCRTIAVSARIASDESHELLHCLGRNRRMDGEYLHRCRPNCHCVEVCHGIIWDLVVKSGIRGEGDMIDKKNCITIRRRLCGPACADVTACAWHVL